MPLHPAPPTEGIDIFDASSGRPRTAERCKEDSRVWSATRDTPGLSNQRALAPQPGVPGRGSPYQGFRSLRSLNPWLPSLHRSAVHPPR